jgi:phage shock protein E
MDTTTDSPARTPAAGTSSGSPLVIDVRSLQEFEALALDGAMHLPLSDLERGIGTVAPDRATPLVLYCASGGRSGMGCMLLRQLGYTQVSNAGGLYAAAATLQRRLIP